MTNNTRKTIAREDNKLLLDIEDGFYYLNAGYEDMKSWQGIEFEYLTENTYEERVTYVYSLATANQLNHLSFDSNISYPVYLFINGIGTLQGYHSISNG